MTQFWSLTLLPLDVVGFVTEALGFELELLDPDGFEFEVLEGFDELEPDGFEAELLDAEGFEFELLELDGFELELLDGFEADELDPEGFELELLEPDGFELELLDGFEADEYGLDGLLLSAAANNIHAVKANIFIFTVYLNGKFKSQRL